LSKWLVAELSSNGVGLGEDGGLMSDSEKADSTDEDWLSYADAGFGSTDYSLWDDAPVKEVEKQQDEWKEPEQLNTHMQEIPSAPAVEGLKHLVRLGSCDYCLGRLSGKRRFGQSDFEAGLEVRASIVEASPALSKSREDALCPFCEELFEEAPLLAELIHESLDGAECDRLQLGARFPKDQVISEDELRKRFGAGGAEPLKASLVAAVATHLRELDSQCNLVNEKPQILALIDVTTLTVELDIRSHFFYGRYRKLERGIPQTVWPCRKCKGRGCNGCDQSGLQYPSSVQSLIGDPLLDMFGSESHSFHGMGREDIDVRCLGSGRPFVIELRSPNKRSIDPAIAMAAINDAANGSIEVNSMRNSNRSEVVRIKDTPAEKSYTIRFKIEALSQERLAELTQPIEIVEEESRKRGRGKKNRRPKKKEEKKEIDYSILKKNELVEICEQKGLKKSGNKQELIDRIQSVDSATLDLPNSELVLKVLSNIQGTTLAQRTPTRVAHRRADKVRKRKVLHAEGALVEIVDGVMEAEISLRCESGTYVKETVHGDDGRTQPSVASMIKAECNVMWLDVADIHAD